MTTIETKSRIALLLTLVAAAGVATSRARGVEHQRARGDSDRRTLASGEGSAVGVCPALLPAVAAPTGDDRQRRARRQRRSRLQRRQWEPRRSGRHRGGRQLPDHARLGADGPSGLRRQRRAGRGPRRQLLRQPDRGGDLRARARQLPACALRRNDDSHRDRRRQRSECRCRQDERRVDHGASRGRRDVRGQLHDRRSWAPTSPM